MTGIGPITRPEIPRLTPVGWWALADPPHRAVCFDADAGYRPTPIVQRSELGAGVRLNGPVIIEEFGSTVPVHPGFTVVVDDFGNLVITKEDQEQGR